MARTAGRQGAVWRRISKQVIAAYGGVCVICGHPGAGDAHHVPPLGQLRAMGLDPNNPAFIRPAHGAHSRCPTCRRCCNQSLRDRPQQPTRASRAW